MLHVESIVLPENASQYIKFRLDFQKSYRFSSAENSGPSEHERENGKCVGSQSQYGPHCLWSSYSVCSSTVIQ